MEPITNEKEKCHRCEKLFDVDDLHETTSGEEFICDTCIDEVCHLCLVGESEMEDNHGEPICSGCYASRCDDAYDYIKDNGGLWYEKE